MIVHLLLCLLRSSNDPWLLFCLNPSSMGCGYAAMCWLLLISLVLFILFLANKLFWTMYTTVFPTSHVRQTAPGSNYLGIHCHNLPADYFLFIWDLLTGCEANDGVNKNTDRVPGLGESRWCVLKNKKKEYSRRSRSTFASEGKGSTYTGSRDFRAPAYIILLSNL